MWKTGKMLILLLATALFVSSCASYSCNAPNGSVCKSVSQVYAEETEEEKQIGEEVTVITKRERVEQISVYEDEKPLWIPAKKLRLWLSRWVDSRGVYHQPGYVYIEVEKGRWNSEEGRIDEKIMEGEQDGDTD